MLEHRNGADIEDFEQFGVRVYWRGLKGDRAVSICQYLDDGAWILTLDPESEDGRRYSALVSAWDAFLGADEHTWYVHPATDDARPYRGIAYEGRSSTARRSSGRGG